MQEISDSRQTASTKDDITELRLCEARMVVLHPGQLYRFTRAPGCQLCEVEAGIAPTPDALTEDEVRALVRDAFLTALGEMDGQCRADREEQAARVIQAEAVAASVAQKLVRRMGSPR